MVSVVAMVMKAKIMPVNTVLWNGMSFLAVMHGTVGSSVGSENHNVTGPCI